jgi:ADP-ribose pyrophosphatase
MSDPSNGGIDEGGTGADGDPTDRLAWKTIERTTAYACPGFSVRHETVELPDGTATEFDYLVEPPAVVVLPRTADGNVVLIEEWREAVGRVNRGLPAGTIEDGDEDLKAAARRELREETGYEAGSITPLVTVEPSNGVSNSVHQYVLATDCRPAGEQELDFNESIRAFEIDYEAFREQIRMGEIRDGRAVLGLSYYELFGDGEN